MATTSAAYNANLMHRVHVWAASADAGETEWAPRRGTVGTVASWSLVFVLLISAYVGRASLGMETESWVLLTAANALALALAIAGLRQSRLPPVLYAGILIVFLLGGVFQLYLLSYNIPRSSSFIRDQAPLLSSATQADISAVYGLITLTFVAFCVMAAIAPCIRVRPRFPRVADLTSPRRLKNLLIWASVGYVGLTLFQAALGFGQSSLPNRPLPLHIVAITLFYRRNFYPTILLVGIWVFDRRDTRVSYACVIATGLMAISESYVSTSRGTLIDYGLPVLFVWLLTGRFTKFRKVLVVGALALYLVVTPLFSALRVNRVRKATGLPSASIAKEHISPLSTASLNRQLGHILLRVGGTFSLVFTIHHESHLNLAGLGKVYRPSGLTSYFTHEVVGIPVNLAVADSQAPTAIGMGVLIGGAAGALLVLALTFVGLDLAWHWIPKRLWSWPVALALLAQGGLVFFSEGVTIQLYKVFLAIAVVEFLYRFVHGPSGRETTREPQEELLSSVGK